MGPSSEPSSEIFPGMQRSRRMWCAKLMYLKRVSSFLNQIASFCGVKSAMCCLSCTLFGRYSTSAWKRSCMSLLSTSARVLHLGKILMKNLLTAKQMFRKSPVRMRLRGPPLGRLVDRLSLMLFAACLIPSTFFSFLSVRASSPSKLSDKRMSHHANHCELSKAKARGYRPVSASEELAKLCRKSW